MTTPTIKQVVQWANECGLTRGQHWNRKNMTTALMTEFATLARADLEATIAEQAAELETERLRLVACGVAALGYFSGCRDEYRSASLDDVLRARAELESLRKDASWNPIATVPDDSTRVLVFSPKFGVWETCGRLAMQPRGDSGWVPIAWKLSAQNSSEIYSAIAAAPAMSNSDMKQEKLE